MVFGYHPRSDFGYHFRLIRAALDRRVLRCQLLDTTVKTLTRAVLSPLYVPCVHFGRKRKQAKKISGHEARRASSGASVALDEAGRAATGNAAVRRDAHSGHSRLVIL